MLYMRGKSCGWNAQVSRKCDISGIVARARVRSGSIGVWSLDGGFCASRKVWFVWVRSGVFVDFGHDGRVDRLIFGLGATVMGNFLPLDDGINRRGCWSM